MSREEILAAIRECAAELKRNPALADLRRMKNVGWGSSENASAGCQLRSARPAWSRWTGYRPTVEALLLDWARVAREQGELPTLFSYEQHGRYSTQPFVPRFGRWSGIPRQFVRFVCRKRMERQWKDVLAMIEKKTRSAPHASLKLDPAKHRPDRPVYGPPLKCPGVAHEPVNEAGVILSLRCLGPAAGLRDVAHADRLPRL